MEPGNQHQPRRHLRRTGRYILNNRERSPLWVWILVVVATVLVTALIAAGATAVGVFTIYKPESMYLQVTTAHLGRLVYSPYDGVIRDIAVSIELFTSNGNTKANVSFSSLDLALGFHGATLTDLKAMPFNVTPEHVVPLHYLVHLAGARLDAAGRRAMQEEINAGLVRLDLDGKARMTLKLGVFPTREFWTRISCPIYLAVPDGNARPVDPRICRSWSP
ncbi:hypothetical protein ACQ4PT_012194 [Festuca glaucescens]